MVKVKLRENVRYFESDDSDFYIQGKQELELPEKHLRSYSIKHGLFHGNLKIIEGFFTFKFKAGMIYVAENVLYCKEYGKYFTKDMELDTIIYVDEDQVPKAILMHIDPTLKVVQDDPIIEVEKNDNPAEQIEIVEEVEPETEEVESPDPEPTPEEEVVESEPEVETEEVDTDDNEIEIDKE